MGRPATKPMNIAKGTEKLERGEKYCDNPNCGKKIASRSLACKYCKEEQTPKIKPAGVKRDGFAVVRSVAAYVKAHGGIGKAKAQLEDLETLLKATGGISEAKAALAEFEAIKGM